MIRTHNLRRVPVRCVPRARVPRRRVLWQSHLPKHRHQRKETLQEQNENKSYRTRHCDHLAPAILPTERCSVDDLGVDHEQTVGRAIDPDGPVAAVDEIAFIVTYLQVQYGVEIGDGAGAREILQGSVKRVSGKQKQFGVAGRIRTVPRKSGAPGTSPVNCSGSKFAGKGWRCWGSADASIVQIHEVSRKRTVERVESMADTYKSCLVRKGLRVSS